MSLQQFIGALVLIVGILYGIMEYHFPLEEIRWDWSQIKDVNSNDFPVNFLWGTSTSAHQIEGNNDNNQWTLWENIPGNIKNGDKQDMKNGGVNHWNMMEQDIMLMKKIGVKSYRFSIEWSKIERVQGTFEREPMDKYKYLLDLLQKSGIEPLITLHHFTDPIWFQELGAFTKTENIRLFVNFARYVYKELLPYNIKMYCTINEPNVYANFGYLTGQFPPGKKDAKLAAIVSSNLMKTHVQVYKTLKSMERGNETMIGLSPNFVHFEPYRKYNPIERYLASIIKNAYIQNIIEYFITGKYRFHQPGIVDHMDENPAAIGALDYIGINFYFNTRVKLNWDIVMPFINVNDESDPQLVTTDMGWAIYPEGLYRAIKQVAPLKVPIYITENGIADAVDTRRDMFIRRYLYALSKAIKDGYDVRGYYWWSLMDNFEWAEGFHPRFGLYEVDYETKKRTLRKGAKFFIEIVSNQTIA
jgi:beta-glucosidase